MNPTTHILAKVNGVLDLCLCNIQKDLSFEEIPPTSIKKLIGGAGTASKLQVQNSLRYYVGEQSYATDDESDAVACGIAYLLLNKIAIRGINLTKLSMEQAENRRKLKEIKKVRQENVAKARLKAQSKK